MFRPSRLSLWLLFITAQAGASTWVDKLLFEAEIFQVNGRTETEVPFSKNYDHAIEHLVTEFPPELELNLPTGLDSDSNAYSQFVDTWNWVKHASPPSWLYANLMLRWTRFLARDLGHEGAAVFFLNTAGRLPHHSTFINSLLPSVSSVYDVGAEISSCQTNQGFVLACAEGAVWRLIMQSVAQWEDYFAAKGPQYPLALIEDNILIGHSGALQMDAWPFMKSFRVVAQTDDGSDQFHKVEIFQGTGMHEPVSHYLPLPFNVYGGPADAQRMERVLGDRWVLRLTADWQALGGFVRISDTTVAAIRRDFEVLKSWNRNSRLWIPRPEMQQPRVHRAGLDRG
ncbi:MAG: hypothetical protein HY537_12800 [Deltaproteobacteria bacterium]|nr:hypothetical protein [Deltaproteobacteria bacterium]